MGKWIHGTLGLSSYQRKMRTLHSLLESLLLVTITFIAIIMTSLILIKEIRTTNQGIYHPALTIQDLLHTYKIPTIKLQG
ncbi:hypothetical protein [Bartonella sp. DGB2]|uniref:hypothetical protein n=1 Tax=Bartonella sp. DGB2 TaxID=3388426 RepID=UPI0039902A1B